MKVIKISSTSIMSTDDMVVDKCSTVSKEHLLSLLDSLAMFFSSKYLDTQCRKYYFVFKHIDFLRDLVGKVDATVICSSLNFFLKSHYIDTLSSFFFKIIVL